MRRRTSPRERSSFLSLASTACSLDLPFHKQCIQQVCAWGIPPKTGVWARPLWEDEQLRVEAPRKTSPEDAGGQRADLEGDGGGVAEGQEESGLLSARLPNPNSRHVHSHHMK
nr:uncharacterized protein LOC120366313 [Saimiri boliviensis boliviensis]